MNDGPRLDKKIFGGPRIRRVRREMGLTQARMAEDLGISASYQNLIERNQRPLTARLLLRLAEVYDIELRGLAGDEEAAAMAGLREVFADPMFAGAGVSEHELRDLVATCPAAAGAVAMLYRAYRDTRMSASTLAERIAGGDEAAGGDGARFPVEEVRDLFHDRNNHFPELDDAGEALFDGAGLGADEPYVALRTRLKERHGVQVRIVPVEVAGAALRRYDYHRRSVFLSEALAQTGRNFQLAFQIGLFELRETIDRLVAGAGLSSEQSRRVCRVGLASYFAGALLLPYGRFRDTAEELRYDIEALGRRFGASFEQVCHRLTTLQRPGARGIPLFVIRLDSAGNVTKRFSAGSFPFARSGGACPRWNVHDVFRNPGQIFTQIVQMPDETTYFSVARTVSRPGWNLRAPDQLLAVGLGCEISYAPRMAYFDGIDAAALDPTPIGINCRLCERPDCYQRAHPPLHHRLTVDENVRGMSPFSFAAD